MAPKKKTHCVGLGGLKVVHSGGNQDWAKERYFASEPGSYTPPEEMRLGKSEPKVAPVIEEKKKTTTAQDAAVKKASKKDLNNRNLH